MPARGSPGTWGTLSPSHAPHPRQRAPHDPPTRSVPPVPSGHPRRGQWGCGLCRTLSPGPGPSPSRQARASSEAGDGAAAGAAGDQRRGSDSSPTARMQPSPRPTHPRAGQGRQPEPASGPRRRRGRQGTRSQGRRRRPGLRSHRVLAERGRRRAGAPGSLGGPTLTHSQLPRGRETKTRTEPGRRRCAAAPFRGCRRARGASRKRLRLLRAIQPTPAPGLPKGRAHALPTHCTDGKTEASPRRVPAASSHRETHTGPWIHPNTHTSRSLPRQPPPPPSADPGEGRGGSGRVLGLQPSTGDRPTRHWCPVPLLPTWLLEAGLGPQDQGHPWGPCESLTLTTLGT